MQESERTMTEKQSEPINPAEQNATEQERRIPKPPSPEELDEISKEQALVTDEWVGDNPADKQGPKQD
jgi:hypothetical protein